MLRIILFLILIVNLLYEGSAQENVSGGVEKNNKSEIRFEKIVFDMGDVEYGSEGTCNFKFENTGTAPLIITSVMTSCDCTAAFWPDKPLKPGQADSIRILYNTHSNGFFFKSIEVQSNAKNSPVILRLKGKVVTKEKK